MTEENINHKQEEARPGEEALPAVSQPAAKKTRASQKKKASKKTSGYKLMGGRGQAHIFASYNNTIVSITDQVGNVIAWSSSGKCGFKGPKKATPFAAGVVVKSMSDRIRSLGIREVDCFLKGVGMGREAAVRALAGNGINILTIKDVTAIPHNGCRPKKPRRV